MLPSLVDLLVARAMEFSFDSLDEDARMAELHRLANGDNQTLEHAIRVCLGQPASLAARHRAIELLARVRYESPAAPGNRPGAPTR